MTKSIFHSESLPTPTGDAIRHAEAVGRDLFAKARKMVEEEKENEADPKRWIKSPDMIGVWSGGEIVLGETDWQETLLIEAIQMGRKVRLNGRSVNSLNPRTRV